MNIKVAAFTISEKSINIRFMCTKTLDNVSFSFLVVNVFQSGSYEPPSKSNWTQGFSRGSVLVFLRKGIDTCDFSEVPDHLPPLDPPLLDRAAYPFPGDRRISNQAQGLQNIFILNSAEDEISTAHRSKIL